MVSHYRQIVVEQLVTVSFRSVTATVPTSHIVGLVPTLYKVCRLFYKMSDISHSIANDGNAAEFAVACGDDHRRPYAFML